MTKQTQVPAVLGRTYHQVSNENSGAGRNRPDRESVSQTFLTEWRGQTVAVDVEASRYASGGHRTNDGIAAGSWTKWRTYVTRARFFDVEADRGLGSVSETARRRLNEQLVPLVEAYLASDSYNESREHAFWNWLRREIGDHRTGWDTKRSRETLDRNRLEITGDHADRLVKVLDLLDLVEEAWKDES